MKKRLWKKKLKINAKDILNQIDPTLQLLFSKGNSRYRYATRTICINPFKVKENYLYFRTYGMNSIYEEIEWTVAHEYGHSTRKDWSEWSKTYDKIYRGIEKVSDREKLKKIAAWKRYIIPEEKRADNVALNHLKFFDRKVAKKLMNHTHYLMEEEIKQIEEMIGIL